ARNVGPYFSGRGGFIQEPPFSASPTTWERHAALSECWSSHRVEWWRTAPQHVLPRIRVRAIGPSSTRRRPYVRDFGRALSGAASGSSPDSCFLIRKRGLSL